MVPGPAEGLTAEYWIDRLRLAPHPEGGYFRETYRASEGVGRKQLPPRFRGARSFSTAIYFLLVGEQVSVLHRLAADELWHYYTGTSALAFQVLAADGVLTELQLGLDPDCGALPQAVIPAGRWFGAVVRDRSGFALVGCTVAPGFDSADFEVGERQDLVGRFPQHEGIITLLTAEGRRGGASDG